MMNKKELNAEEMEQVNGGLRFFYNTLPTEEAEQQTAQFKTTNSDTVTVFIPKDDNF